MDRDRFASHPIQLNYNFYLNFRMKKINYQLLDNRVHRKLLLQLGCHRDMSRKTGVYSYLQLRGFRQRILTENFKMSYDFCVILGLTSSFKRAVVDE